MKNVLMTLILFGGFFVAQVSAQSCKPGPQCQPACCKKAGIAASATKAPNETAEVQIMPATLDVFNTCTPEQIAACKASGMTDEQIEACKAACASKSATSCGNKKGATFVSQSIPSCTPAANESARHTEASIDKKYHTNVKPSKS